MSFLVYQRSDPRCKDWLPLLSQQIRLRNVIQIIGLNLNIENRDDEVYFTLHTRAMSTPFFTSERLKSKRRVVTWKEIEPRQIPESVRLSAPGFIIRVWSVSKDGGGGEPLRDSSIPKQLQQKKVTSWGLYLGGLHYLGSKGDWNTKEFVSNTLLFRMPFGFFTSVDSLLKPPLSTYRYLRMQVPTEQVRSSYTLKKLSSLHSIQRSVLDEISLGQDLKSRICLYGYSQNVDPDSSSQSSSNILGEKSLMRAKEGKIRLELKERIESMRQRVTILRDEKVRRFGCVIQLKKDFYDCQDISMDLMGRMQMLGREMERLRELKATVQERKVKLSQISAQLVQRKRELVSELLLIYPISLVEGSKKYSINEIQLPNAEDYGTETGGQISVALGYTAHLTAMISFLLGIPLRYPVRHFGSQSRIVDHITEAITDKEREFPLYFRNKEDVYSRYAVYLLNKNIAQLRWYCGLSTPELRATLPNLYSVLHDRLIIPGWPPSPSESLEMAQELTEEVDPQLFSSLSLDKGLDQLLVLPEKDMENAWLRNSFSDLDVVGGNNAVPSGEVQHGKTQDRFLNGWRRKTYESEEIDPRWLTNSLTLELDSGRRLSNSSFPRPPLVLVSDESKAVRRRRVGRVEQVPFTRLGSPNSKGRSPDPPSPTSPLSEPNENLSHIENQITKFERRRSMCSGTSTPSPTHALGSPAEDLDISTMTLPLANDDTYVLDEQNEEAFLNTTPPIPTEYPAPCQDLDENEVGGSTMMAENTTTEECGDILRLEPKYDPSSDERGDPPSPAFGRKMTAVPSQAPDSSDTTVTSLKFIPEIIIPRLEDEERLNPLNLPIDNRPTFESSYKIQLPVPVTCDSTPTASTAGPLVSSTESSTTTGDSDETLEQEEAGGDEDEDFGTDFENESLWLRTAAAFNPQSYNVIKRKISESN